MTCFWRGGADACITPCENGVPSPFHSRPSTPEEAISVVSSATYEPPFIEIASLYRGRDIPEPFPFSQGTFFPLQHNSFIDDAGSSIPRRGVGTFRLLWMSKRKRTTIIMADTIWLVHHYIEASLAYAEVSLRGSSGKGGTFRLLS